MTRVKAIEALGRKAVALHLNMADIKSLDPFVQQVAATLQSKWNTSAFDFLINNAGIGGGVPFDKVTEDMFDEFLNVHFKGVYFLTQKSLPTLTTAAGLLIFPPALPALQIRVTPYMLP